MIKKAAGDSAANAATVSDYVSSVDLTVAEHMSISCVHFNSVCDPNNLVSGSCADPVPVPPCSTPNCDDIYLGVKEVSEPSSDISSTSLISSATLPSPTVAGNNDVICTTAQEPVLCTIPPIVFDWFDTPLVEVLSSHNDCFSSQYKPPPSPVLYKPTLLSFWPFSADQDWSCAKQLSLFMMQFVKRVFLIFLKHGCPFPQALI